MNFGKTRIDLTQEEMPRSYYNILPDLPRRLDPPLSPVDNTPLPPQAFEMFFTKEAARQEFSQEESIRIPDEVADAYFRLGRPTPLVRARRLEKYLKTPARIYFKREDVNPCGSHKPNSAIPQAYYAMKQGIEALTTETGAGQWGTALAYACGLFDLKCKVYMVRGSYDQKPYRREMIRLFGAEVFASPSDTTEYGRKLLKENPNQTGTLGIAISEALEVMMKAQSTKYALGSVLNHVMLHQTVIGQEVLQQLAKVDETPDEMIACVGGGSNFAGFAFPMMGKKLKKKGFANTEFVAVEPTSVPSLTKGEYRYDFGDTAGMAPVMKMYTLGREYAPPSIHAGGLRYHGMSPIVSLLADEKAISSRAYGQNEVFAAGALFAKTEGIIPAPESSHAIKAAIDDALACKQKNEEKVIVFNLSGHGLLDLGGYSDYLSGKLQ